ncbi:MAG: aldehyde dehydrogenase family protein [Coprothermobacterota bacterium]|nr:aldehyde dehydrogenase family protein [Coprothermobacterota bacterium]
MVSGLGRLSARMVVNTSGQEEEMEIESKRFDVEEVMERAALAAAVFSQLDQEHTDRIVRAAYLAGFNARVRLAKMACEETGLGIWQDKVIKNVLATQLVYEDIKDEKTVGVIGEDRERGIVEIAQPLGPILAVAPVTNPTSTVMFKILIALKTRNPILIRPHNRAIRCSSEAARIMYEAALSEDAPEDCVQWLGNTSREETHALMSHKRLALILATGGAGLVKSAYSSGTPAIGVGAGNVPVYIERSADIPFAVEQILISKTFDNGTVCASEQAVVTERALTGQVMAEFQRRGAYFLNEEETHKVEAVAFDQEQGVMSMDVVGQPAAHIARLAGIEAPSDVTLLIAPQKKVGKGYPLSSEILAPILAYYVVESLPEAINLCIELNYHGGIGHTVSIFSNDEEVIRQFAAAMNAGRILVNTPSSQGAVGAIYNRLAPSLTLGCGTGGKNITTDNITAHHLLNIQRIARRRVNEELELFDKSLYLDESMDAAAVEKLYHRNR